MQCIEHYIIQCRENNAYNTDHRVQCKKYKKEHTIQQWIWYNTFNTLKMIQCTEFNVLNTVDIIQSIEYNAHNII